MKRTPFIFGTASLVAGGVLLVSNFLMHRHHLAEREVPDWQSMPAPEVGSLVVDARRTAKLWYDGRSWKVVEGSCGDIFEVRIRVSPTTAPPAADAEPLITTGAPGLANIVCLLPQPDGSYRVGVEVWGQQMKTGRPFRSAAGTFLLNVSIDRVNDLVRASLDDDPVPVLETRLKPWPLDSLPWSVGSNSLGGSYVGPVFAGTVTVVSRESHDEPGARRPSGVHLKVLFSRGRIGPGMPLLSSGVMGRADLIYVVLDDPSHLHFALDHWAAGGAKGPSVFFDPRVAHDIVIDSSAARELAGTGSDSDRSYRVTLDGLDVFRGEMPHYPADAAHIFIGSNPIGGSTTDAQFEGDVLEKGISY